MQYDKSVPGLGLGDIPYCLKVGKATATDFHTLFIALGAREQHPSALEHGLPAPTGTARRAAPAGGEGLPLLAEFYAPGGPAGWAVDISEAWKHPELKD